MVTAMRIVCCDDDTRIIEQLKEYLQLYFKKISTPFPEFASFTSGEELLKDSQPIDKNRLFRNMKDALLRYSTVSKKIQIETKNQTDIVYMKDIIFVEARERKVFVYTQKTIYESVQKIQFWAEKLPQSCFFQTHRSYIVNLRFVSRYDNSLVNLCNNKYRAYLTRRKYNSFKNAYITYLESMR